MVIAALRGEIAVNLRGTSDTTRRGKLVNTFATVPDAPIERFNLDIRGGKNGILAVTRTRKIRRLNIYNTMQIQRPTLTAKTPNATTATSASKGLQEEQGRQTQKPPNATAPAANPSLQRRPERQSTVDRPTPNTHLRPTNRRRALETLPQGATDQEAAYSFAREPRA